MTVLLRNRKRDRIRACAANLRTVCAIAGAVVVSAGCATTMGGASMQRVAVASDPPGAQVFIGDEAVGVTPAWVELDRRDGDLALRFEKDCYRDTVLPVPRRVSKRVLVNLLAAGVPINDYTLGPWLGTLAFYGVLGGIVDRVSGAAFSFPDLVRARLDPAPATGPEEPGGGVEPDRGCAPGAPAGAGDQGNTPSDR